jgi:RNA polymerase sigma factor (sigma-70 family)
MGELTLPIRSLPELALAGRLSSDEQLAQLVARGSARAFAVLYQRHHQALYRYCRSIVREENDAQDALQSAMTRALAALRVEERDLAVRPWLFRIVHNEAVSILRRRHPTVALAEELEPADLGVERAQEGRERLAMLVADLQALPERQRSALIMRELSGLSIAEIAGVLSTSPGATKQVLFEARGALADFAEGRAMECEQVRQAISDGDRRVLRGRKLRGHMRDCRGCRDFQVAISSRSADLRALAPPLPGVAAAAMLGRLLAHGVGGGHTGGMVAGSGAAIGNSATASLTVKTLAGVATVTVAVAGGAHLALVHGPHGHSRAATRQGARLLSPALATMRTGVTAGQGDTPLFEAPAANRRLGAARGPIEAVGVRDKTSLSSRAGTGAPSTPNDHLSTGFGLSLTPRGHSKTTSEGHSVSHRTHRGNTGSHRSSGSSRAGHGGSASRKQAPARPAKPTSRHGHTQVETDQPAPQAPSVPNDRHGEALGTTQEHGSPGVPKRVQAPKTVRPLQAKIMSIRAEAPRQVDGQPLRCAQTRSRCWP